MSTATERPAATKLSSIAQLLRLVAPYRWRWVCAIIALLFTAGITLTIGQGVRMVIDDGFVAGSVSQLQQGIYLLLGLSVLMAAGTFVRFYLVSWLGERVSADIRSAVFNNIVSLSPGYFDDNRSGEIMSRLTTDTTLLQSIVGSSFSLALRSSISTTGALIILLITNLKLTLVILGFIPLVLLPILIFGRRVRALSRKSQDSIANVGTYAGEIITQLKTVQSYTREDYERSAFGEEVENAFAIARSRVKQRAVLMAAVIVLIYGALSGMLWVGGNDVLNGTMSAGDLGAFVFYAMLVAMGVATMSEVYGDLQRAVGATDRLVDLMTAKATILPPDSAAVAASNLAAEVSFKQVNFSYPSRPAQKALEDFSIHIPEGKVVALVGPSGAGKSTVFELMQRFYDPQAGTVLLGDTDIRELSPADLCHLPTCASSWVWFLSTPPCSVPMLATIFATANPMPATRKYMPQRRPPTPTILSSNCPRATPAFSASRACDYRAGKNNASPSPALFSKTPTCFYWMRRQVPSTPIANNKCSWRWISS